MNKMVEVTQEDANNYSRILTLLGMEEEGDPVSDIEALKADAEQWRKYKARKEAVLAAGMGRSPLRQKQPCGECHLNPGEVCDICGASTKETP